MLFLPILLAHGALKAWAASQQQGFEKELMGRLLAGRGEEALAYLRGRRFFRFASPGYYLQGKLGLVHQQLGQHEAAALAFRQALEEAPSRKGFALALGLGDSLFALGQDFEAEQVYRAAIDDEHASPRACANLARLVRRRGGELEEVETLLRRALDAQRGGGLIRCELAQVLAARGKLEDARFEVALAAEELGADLRAEERTALEAARAAVGEATPAAEGPAQIASTKPSADS